MISLNDSPIAEKSALKIKSEVLQKSIYNYISSEFAATEYNKDVS